MPKSCSVTGHRTILYGQIGYVKEELRNEICRAIKAGYTHFISGFATGTDLYFADIIAELKKENTEITLEAAIPYRKRLNANDREFQRLIKLCDKVTVISETYYKACFFERNIYMVSQSELVIAVFDGREKSGTGFTIQKAREKNCELRIIDIVKQ